MTADQKTANVTVRGGLINVPESTNPTQPIRHRPNTPNNKKTLQSKPDHRPYTPDPDQAQTKTGPCLEDNHPPPPPEPESTPTDEVPEEIE